MMDGYWGYGMNNGGGIWGFIVMATMMVLVIVGVIVTIQYLARQNSTHGSKPALDILEKRFANGEIDAKEFETKRKILSE